VADFPKGSELAHLSRIFLCDFVRKWWLMTLNNLVRLLFLEKDGRRNPGIPTRQGSKSTTENGGDLIDWSIPKRFAGCHSVL